MRVRGFIALAAAGLSLGVFAAPAFAAGNGSNATCGDAVSDGFYGNEPNIVGPFAPGGPAEQEPGTQAGRVVPSQSPGPFVTLSDGTVVKGNSLGYYVGGQSPFGGPGDLAPGPACN